MPEQTSPRPDPWRQVWRIATGNRLLAASLIAIALYLLLLSFIPQFSPESGLMAYWSAQTRFGRATGLLYRMGLFSATDSPVAPLLLSVLGFLALLRAIGRLEGLASSLLERKTPSRQIFPLLAELGALLLLGGLLVGRIWGWRVGGLVGETGVPVPGRNLTLEMTAAGPRVHPPEAQVYIVGYGVRVTVRAVGPNGEALSLQQAPRESPQPILSLYLTPGAPEASLAVLEAGLVVQLRAREIPFSYPAVEGIVFRAPSGEQVATALLEPGPSALTVDQVQIDLHIGTCPLVAVGKDPGQGLKAAGLLLGTVGVVGTVAPWRRRRWGARLALALGTLGLSGWTFLSLVTTGLLARAPLHTGLAALWGIDLSVWMLRPPGREELSLQEEE